MLKLKTPAPPSLSLLGTIAALFMLAALLLPSAAMAEEEGKGCPNPGGRPTSNKLEAWFDEEGNTATYYFKSVDAESNSGTPGLKKYCVYPGTNPDNVTVYTGSEGAVGYNGEFWIDPQEEAFSFDAPSGFGEEANIPFDGTTRKMGTATWEGGVPEGQQIVLHIGDPAECEALGLNPPTCFVYGGEIAPPAADLEASKTATPFFERTYEWEIEKEVDKTKVEIAEGGTATFNYTVKVSHDEGTDGGWTVTGAITVNNPNSGEVTGVEVTDAIDDPNAECTVTGGSNATIPAEGTEEFEYECTYSEAPEATEQTNTATVSWPEQEVDGAHLNEGSVEPTAAVDWTSVEPEIIDGEAEVEDSLGGFLGTASYTEENPIAFEYSKEFEGDPAGTCTGHDNTATFTTNDTGAEGSDSKEVEVCVGKDLTVEKDATPFFKRTYEWEIEKEVDKTKVEIAEGGTATFNYTVKVSHDEGTDSGWKVTGTITVENPNDWEPITVNVADEIEADGNAECTVEGEAEKEAEIPASSSEEFEYECTYSGAPEAAEETNKATATWDGEEAHTPSGTASGTAAVEWGEPSELIDECVDVTDTVDGEPVPPLAEGLCESKTFEYEVTFPIESGCVTHTNTATFTTNDTGAEGSDDAEVEVCGFAKTGARTMGFWQNKNGQRIISKSGPKSGTCDLTAWLRQFAPFQDLSASATCKQVAAYVYDTIKGAKAAGESMNPMLKAQMLATALDVYFSDPALGGNEIHANVPIGEVGIDLTMVCKDIATCSVYEDTSGAFGGASSLTVMEILEYAAGESNSGGSSWYGNDKSTQELAKDTFDAINNEVAFGA